MHVLSKYAHLQKVLISIDQLRWSRITVSGQDEPSTHASYRDGDDKRVVRVAVSFFGARYSIWARSTFLLVMKRGPTKLVAFRVEPAVNATDDGTRRLHMDPGLWVLPVEPSGFPFTYINLTRCRRRSGWAHTFFLPMLNLILSL